MLQVNSRHIGYVNDIVDQRLNEYNPPVIATDVDAFSAALVVRCEVSLCVLLVAIPFFKFNMRTLDVTVQSLLFTSDRVQVVDEEHPFVLAHGVGQEDGGDTTARIRHDPHEVAGEEGNLLECSPQLYGHVLVG